MVTFAAATKNYPSFPTRAPAQRRVDHFVAITCSDPNDSHDLSTADCQTLAQLVSPSRDPIGFTSGLNGYPSRSMTKDPLGLDDDDDDDEDGLAEVPGTFYVSIRREKALDGKSECCSASVSVKYSPTAADKATFVRIEMINWAETTIDYHTPCPYWKSTKVWHADPPKDEQICWPTGLFPEWADTPGGGPRLDGNKDPGESYGDFDDSFVRGCLCPGYCAWKSLKQDFETCAIGTTATGTKKTLGCVTYGHSCNIDYFSSRRDYGSGGTRRVCVAKCTVTRYGLSVDWTNPGSPPKHQPMH